MTIKMATLFPGQASPVHQPGYMRQIVQRQLLNYRLFENEMLPGWRNEQMDELS
jgi:hypothetical protein